MGNRFALNWLRSDHLLLCVCVWGGGGGGVGSKIFLEKNPEPNLPEKKYSGQEKFYYTLCIFCKKKEDRIASQTKQISRPEDIFLHPQH